MLQPILEKHQVDVYLSGHEHSMQHLKSSKGHFHQFISGAGSEVTPVKQNLDYSRFAASEYGFMYFAVNTSQLRCTIIDHDGKTTYSTLLSK